jgi:hypothetical protein
MKKLFDRYPVSILLGVVILIIILALLTSCSAEPHMKKDCRGIKHYRQNNGIYVSKGYWCDSANTYVWVPLYRYSMSH